MAADFSDAKSVHPTCTGTTQIINITGKWLQIRIKNWSTTNKLWLVTASTEAGLTSVSASASGTDVIGPGEWGFVSTESNAGTWLAILGTSSDTYSVVGENV